MRKKYTSTDKKLIVNKFFDSKSTKFDFCKAEDIAYSQQLTVNGILHYGQVTLNAASNQLQVLTQ